MLADLSALLEPVEGSDAGTEAPAKKRNDHPQGFEPGVAWSGHTGSLTVAAEHAPSCWDDHLRRYGYDPEQFEIVEPVQVRAWESLGKDGAIITLNYFRATMRQRRIRRADFADLIAEIKRFRPRRPSQEPNESASSFAVVLSDWQLGKADGDGLRGTVARVLLAGDQVEQRVRELRKLKRPLVRLYVLGLGDIVEGCDGHYAAQSATVEADRREQTKLARRLLRDLIVRWSKLFDSVIVAAVPGNHGENRRDGKSFTSALGTDNDDVAVFEQVAEILAANPEAFGHVSFVIPADALNVTLDVDGVVLGLTHGHAAKVAGATPEAKLMRWHQMQAHGRQPIGDADILVSGHYHSFRLAEWGAVTWMQAPALDGGSEWFTASKGAADRAGVLTFVIDEHGVSDLAVLR